MQLTMKRPILTTSLAATALLAACGGSKNAGDTTQAAGATTSAAATTAGGEQTPDAGGKVITVQMMTDEAGQNRFDPAQIDAKKGDVIRYTLKVGVHNVHFLPDSNPGASGLPAAPSDMLQLPGQTYDVKATWAPGTYYFQCDPHALLGMKGHVKVSS